MQGIYRHFRSFMVSYYIEKRTERTVLSIVFRKIVSGKMKFCAGKSGEGAAKPRLGASEHVPAALSRVPRQRHSSE